MPDAVDNMSWPLKRLLMAEINNNLSDEPPNTFASSLESLKGGYIPYTGFDPVAVQTELEALIAQLGGHMENWNFIESSDWTKYRKCNLHGPDPVG